MAAARPAPEVREVLAPQRAEGALCRRSSFIPFTASPAEARSQRMEAERCRRQKKIMEDHLKSMSRSNKQFNKFSI